MCRRGSHLKCDCYLQPGKRKKPPQLHPRGKAVPQQREIRWARSNLFSSIPTTDAGIVRGHCQSRAPRALQLAKELDLSPPQSTVTLHISSTAPSTRNLWTLIFLPTGTMAAQAEDVYCTVSLLSKTFVSIELMLNKKRSSL